VATGNSALHQIDADALRRHDPGQHRKIALGDAASVSVMAADRLIRTGGRGLGRPVPLVLREGRVPTDHRGRDVHPVRRVQRLLSIAAVDRPGSDPRAGFATTGVVAIDPGNRSATERPVGGPARSHRPDASSHRRPISPNWLHSTRS
jgi:hypothetical protein